MPAPGVLCSGAKGRESREKSGPNRALKRRTRLCRRTSRPQLQETRNAPNPTGRALGATAVHHRGSKSRERDTALGGDGGGGGNRTHVRWTVLARHYERSLRFIFARRKPTGGPLARLVRFCSPLTPTNLRVPGKLAWFTPKPAALARSGGRRYLRSECQRCFVGSYTGARFVEITRLGSRLAAPGPPSRPFAPTMTGKSIIPYCELKGKGHANHRLVSLWRLAQMSGNGRITAESQST